MLSLLLLHLLSEQESYGYELVKRLHALGLTDVLEGTVYRHCRGSSGRTASHRG
ncbi:MAG: transcriptional regulator, PadR-like family [Frankiales bacterium]|nr:transcriptional regulator, PadR-like family [Frankiales bacterium]